MTAQVEFRAKRTHARRSCDLCKLRKTRCELPDLEITASPDPQPYEKSCHRCQVLSLPCIVDDTKGKPKPKLDTLGMPMSRSASASGSGSRDRATSPKKRKTARASNGSAHTGGETKTLASIVNDSLELMHSFDEELDPALRKTSAASTPTGFGVIQGSMSGNWQVERERSMKYHGRPAELVAAMLTVAYGRVRTLAPRQAFAAEVDLERLIDEPTRTRLEPGYTKLRTFHPHLVPLQNLLSSTDEGAGPSRPLLISVSVYLSTLVLAPSNGQRLRDILTPYIYALRDAVVQQLPQSFTTMQALELLAVHAPYGVLPLDSTRLSSIALARGSILAASAVASQLNVARMVQAMSHVGSFHRWMATDTWTWLSTCAAEAAYKLEDEVARAPPSLADARSIAESMFDPAERDCWHQGAGAVDEADFVGRLQVCDKLLRTAEVLDSLARSRNILETAAKDRNFDATEAMEAEFKYVFARLDDLDQTHETILNMLGHKTDVLVGARSYRHFRKRYENIKILVVGLRCLMAVQFVHDPNTPIPKVQAAMARAYNPTECMPLLEDGSRAYTRLVWQWGRVRGDYADQIMGSSADLLDGILQTGRYAMCPVVEVMCCTVESAKNLLEMQAWKMAMYRVHRPVLHEARYPPWIASMRAVSTSMVRLAGFTTPTIKGSEPIANGCANLIASMSRIADDRSMMLDNHPETASDHPTPVQMPLLNGEHIINDDIMQDNRIATSGPPGQGPLVTHHDYMNTSDRWMAGSTSTSATRSGSAHVDLSAHDPSNAPRVQSDTLHPVNPTNGYPVMIDQILSEAFAYSYNPPVPPAPPPQPVAPVYNGHGEHAMWPNMGHN